MFGRDVSSLPQRELFGLRRRMGMLFQNGALLTDLSVFENVAFPLREHTRLPESLIRQLVLTKLHAVGLRGAANLMPAELSGGMDRRVALARAIVMDPEVLIYDEPFVGLDPISMGVIVRLIRQMNDALGITSIVVSHDVEELAAIARRELPALAGQGRGVGHAGRTAREQPRSRAPVHGGHRGRAGAVPLSGAGLFRPAAGEGTGNERGRPGAGRPVRRDAAPRGRDRRVLLPRSSRSAARR